MSAKTNMGTLCTFTILRFRAPLCLEGASFDCSDFVFCRQGCQVVILEIYIIIFISPRLIRFSADVQGGPMPAAAFGNGFACALPLTLDTHRLPRPAARLRQALMGLSRAPALRLRPPSLLRRHRDHAAECWPHPYIGTHSPSQKIHQSSTLAMQTAASAISPI